VEIVENKCEGMIRLRDLDDDFYEFDETNYRVVGSRTGRIYSMGDEVKVQVMRCDLLKKQIDLRMISDITAVKKTSSPSRSGTYQKPFQGRKQQDSRRKENRGKHSGKKKRR
jgi:ribonuclease R